MPSAGWQAVTKAHRSQGRVALTAATGTSEALTGRPVEVGRVVRFHG